jgi:hypothetical protein
MQQLYRGASERSSGCGAGRGVRLACAMTMESLGPIPFISHMSGSTVEFADALDRSKARIKEFAVGSGRPVSCRSICAVPDLRVPTGSEACAR